MGKIDVELLESTVYGWKRGSVTNETLRDELLKAGRVVVPDGSYPGDSFRDIDWYRLRTRIGELADYGVRNAKSWNKAIDAGDGGTQEAVKAQTTDSNGLFAVTAMLEELVDRKTRKTADGGDIPTPGTPAWAVSLLADVKAIKAKVGA